MATKNIARSTIEGGRINRNKHDRRQSNRDERAATRAFVSKINKSDDPDDIKSPDPKREQVYKVFGDKLSAMERYLEKCVGRPWRLVYAEIREKFDSRTTAGRHIMFDHLLRQVTGAGMQEGMYKGKRSGNYYLDRHGILRESPDRYKRKHYHYIPVDWKAVCAWLNGRRLGLVGDNRLFWFVLTSGAETIATYGYNSTPSSYFNHSAPLKYYKAKDGKMEMFKRRPSYVGEVVSDKEYPMEVNGSWRQSEAAAVADVDYFNKLPVSARELLLSYSPTNKTKRKNF